MNLLSNDLTIGYEIFNVGTGENYSYNHVFNILNQVLHTSIEPIYVNNPLNSYLKDTLADTEKAEHLLDFKAAIKLEEGIRKQVENYETG